MISAALTRNGALEDRCGLFRRHGWQGRSFNVAQVHNFSYGLLNPVLAYLVSCLGCFLGLQCTARALAMQGGARARWLLLAAV